MTENTHQSYDPNYQNSAGQNMQAQTNTLQPQYNHPGAYTREGLQTSNAQPKGFCMICGHQLDTIMKFCPRCGTATVPQAPQTGAPTAEAVPPMPQAGIATAEPIPTVPQAGITTAGPVPPMPQAGAPTAVGVHAALPENVLHNCAVCNQPTSNSDTYVSVISGIQTNIGKSKDKKDLYQKEPNLKSTAPICGRCKDDGTRKIKKMRLPNCILAVLFWPIGIALFIGGIALFFSDYLWIPLGNFQIKPYIFAFILCIPGVFVISLAARFGKRGFSKPEKILILDTEEKLKARVLNELKEAGMQKDSMFAVTVKEAANLQRQNTAALKACKYPFPDPIR